MLIEYLFECSDMEVIPKSLMKALSLVNTRNVDHKVFPREAVEQETKCILNVSAQVKEIFWQYIPDNDAYMEDSDDDDGENCSLFDNEEFVNRDSRLQNIKLQAT
ncbi:unnamed protein product [Arabis nemorensis]|uniref:Uncharacterized protein n=1 Tax=Arabis nemorensis TaxID=586526 RepID=A0A565CAF3_9BRAS|nr:unnamed protein product [Arabis nemorensis]